MTDTASAIDRRPQFVCLIGLLLQAILFGVLLGVGLWIDSDGVVACARHLLGGVPIWLILFVIFVQRKRSRVEDLETEQLRRARDAGIATNIFDVGDEAMLLERRRLNWTYKFLLPAFALLVAAYHVVGPFLFWSWSLRLGLGQDGWHRATEPLLPMCFVGGAAFCSFLYARYVVGMSRKPEWSLLRAGGSYLIGNALTSALLVVLLALSGNESTGTWAEPLAAYVIRLAMLLLGLEFLANFILDFYRPRRTEEEIRPAFDSRLLSLFSETGGIMRSIADTINYQFGFEVSSTWFYQLLQRSIFPLVVMTAVILFLLSGVVIIDVDEEAIITRFGQPLQKAGSTIGPGFHLKFPWPIDHVERARVEKVRTLTVGADGHGENPMRDAGHEHENEMQHAVLWTEEHEFNPETMMIVAGPQLKGLSLDQTNGEPNGARSVAVGLMMISMHVEYRINDLHAYKFRFRDPKRVLESIAYQELSDYASSVDSMHLMGQGRESFGQRMMDTLQRRCDEFQLGIDITFVALQDAHPPSKSDVAKTFQNVVAAEIRRAATVANAEGEARRTLTLTAGSLRRARELDEAIQNMDRLTAAAERENSPETHEQADHAAEQVESLLLGNEVLGIPPASGAVAKLIDDAHAAKGAAISRAESKTRTFANDLRAFRAAPKLYLTRLYLEMIGRALPELRKFVITGDQSNIIIEYQTEQKASLDLETIQPSS